MTPASARGRRTTSEDRWRPGASSARGLELQPETTDLHHPPVWRARCRRGRGAGGACSLGEVSTRRIFGRFCHYYASRTRLECGLNRARSLRWVSPGLCSPAGRLFAVSLVTFPGHNCTRSCGRRRQSINLRSRVEHLSGHEEPSIEIDVHAANAVGNRDCVSCLPHECECEIAFWGRSLPRAEMRVERREIVQ